MEDKLELIKSIAIEASEIQFGQGWDEAPENQDSLKNIQKLIERSAKLQSEEQS